MLKKRKTQIFNNLVMLLCLMCISPVHAEMANGEQHDFNSEMFEIMGARAGTEALGLIGAETKAVKAGNMIALTNAGYAEIKGAETAAALDGLGRVTQTSRGRRTLIEILTGHHMPLWFAVYDKTTGKCAYLETASLPDLSVEAVRNLPVVQLFAVRSVESVRASDIFADPVTFSEKVKTKPFGGNEFRIITIANAAAQGAPMCAVRAFELHDHYCPGVTSGIMMANYVKKHLPLIKDGKYFVHSVQPWCKEDALMVLLNTTPGKRSYAADYPDDAEKARIKAEAKDAATIVYRFNPETKKWDGLVLGFQWAGKTTCPETGSALIDKLCADLFYLKHLNQPEEYVKIIKAFNMPENITPQDWARPEVSPLYELGLIKN